jgi:protein phosphatase
MLPAPSELLIAHDTHPGETGKNNEDNHAVASWLTPAGTPITLAVVADGIGGNRAGEVASALVIETILETVPTSPHADYRVLIRQAIGEAARRVVEQAETSAKLHGMGTTCVMALIAGRELYAAYIGDSRLYLLRENSIQQLSVDHTWIQEAIELRLLTRAEAKTHPHRHVVRRHIGEDPNVPPDFRLRLANGEPDTHAEQNQGLVLAPGQMVLLCSDGLTDLVEDQEIFTICQAQLVDEAVQELITLARQRGGHDNITVILVRVPEA